MTEHESVRPEIWMLFTAGQRAGLRYTRGRHQYRTGVNCATVLVVCFSGHAETRAQGLHVHQQDVCKHEQDSAACMGVAFCAQLLSSLPFPWVTSSVSGSHYQALPLKSFLIHMMPPPSHTNSTNFPGPHILQPPHTALHRLTLSLNGHMPLTPRAVVVWCCRSGLRGCTVGSACR